MILFGMICSLFLICSLRFSKILSRFGENLMRTEIFPAVSITSESVLEDLLRPLYLNLKSGSGSGCNWLSAALSKLEWQHQTFFPACYWHHQDVFHGIVVIEYL